MGGPRRAVPAAGRPYPAQSLGTRPVPGADPVGPRPPPPPARPPPPLPPPPPVRAAFPRPSPGSAPSGVRGPVAHAPPASTAVLDSLSAAVGRQPYVSQVVSAKTLGDSTFVSSDHPTTFLIAALAPDRTADITKTFIPDLRDTVHGALDRVPDAVGFDVKVTGNPALDHDTRTITR